MFSLIRKKHLFLSVLMVALFPSISFGQIDYCTLSEKRINIHLFGASFTSDVSRSFLAKGLDQIYKSFEMGDEVHLIVHSKSGAKAQKRCVPGCPDKGIMKNLVDGTCSEQIAKRDRVKFNNAYARSVKMAVSHAGDKYDEIADLKSLSAYYEGRDADNSETFVFHTTLPYGATIDDRKSFDQAFVRAAQGNELSKIALPDVFFVNADRSEAVESFWQDLKLGGHERGAAFEFKHIVLD